ncbi:MAG: sensor histidine kinase, partial [Planctomycetia bacterium]|nr:sensor histidine kinase [Planctomycetia bacterium]
ADEIGRLVTGVNRMSATLASLRGSLVAGERQRLLGQLAAGFAHELRNAITGARLAIDLHRRRCHPPAGRGAEDDGLAVAVRQLGIVEEEVRGLLALGQPAGAAAAAVSLDVAEVCAEVRDLTTPRCVHVGVCLECDVPAGIVVVGRREALRAALVNLALNGIDAAGPGGTVRIVADRAHDRLRLVVEDSGPGPPPELADTLHEPFVTGKPEGIGLGLAVVKAVAEEHGGELSWSRSDGLTRFAISLPAQTLSAVTPRTDFPA